MQTKECALCGKIIEKPKNFGNKNWINKKFCSNSCSAQNQKGKKRSPHTESFKKSVSYRHKGKKLSDETKRKISETRLKKQIGKGKRLSKETKEKMSASRKGEKSSSWKGGLPNCNDCEKKLTNYKSKRCWKCNVKSLVGEKSHLWRGGISKKAGYASLKAHKRKIKKKGNGGSHTLGEWELLKKQYNFTCLCCKESEPKIKLTKDHIIPISKGGSDNIENIQPLCRS